MPKNSDFCIQKSVVPTRIRRAYGTFLQLKSLSKSLVLSRNREVRHTDPAREHDRPPEKLKNVQ